MTDKLKVLITDDEKHIQNIVTNMLEIDFDITFFYANNGTEALEVIKSNDIDVVISDIRMPKKDGINFLSELKEISVGIPFIFVTGTKDVKYVVEALRYGAYDLLDKPFEMEQMLNVFKGAVEYRELFIKATEYFKQNSPEGFFPERVIENLSKSLSRRML